jgi:uncharacterized protein
MSLPPFHLAIPVHDIAAARAFYGDLLGCREGRSDEGWVDFNLSGHQLVAHLHAGMQAAELHRNEVDAHGVPVPHFGLVLEWQAWQALAAKLRAVETAFVIEPSVRFAGKVGEQATMFLLDPSGNALEFKAFRDPSMLFARSGHEDAQ